MRRKNDIVKRRRCAVRRKSGKKLGTERDGGKQVSSAGSIQKIDPGLYFVLKVLARNRAQLS